MFAFLKSGETLTSSRLVQLFLYFLLSFYWLVLIHIPWPNSGDYGMNLPMNLLSWAAISLQALIVWLSLRSEKIRLTPTFLCLLFAAIAFTLPLSWSPAQGLPIALPRLMGIWGGVFTYLSLLQYPPREKEIVALSYMIAAAAGIETVYSLMSFWCPQWLPFPLNSLAESYPGGAPGIFEQRNVTATFLATGLSLLQVLMADKQRALKSVRAETARRFAICFAIILLSATLVLCRSRIGWLGGLCGIACASLLFSQTCWRGRTTVRHRLAIVILPFIGGLLGTVLLNGSVLNSLVHEGSNHQRLLTLEYTVRLILAHPWKGTGLGMFESVYQNFMANLPFANPNREMMQHPHNETLFIQAEGGIIALLGGLILLWGWVILFRRKKSLWQWVALLTTLPILLHTQVEFPLYYSVAHFFAVLLLMAAAEGQKCTFTLPLNFLRPALAAAALYGIVLSMQLFCTSVTLGEFETGRLEQPESIHQLSVPWLMQMRWQRDLSRLHLMRFNQSGDINELQFFARENAEWIKMHMEEDAWSDQINILMFLQKREEAQALRLQAHRIMPWDTRFNPGE
ncbi:TPA: O-antigen ligase C-terminal domain-containing protein [Citrobacter amalonaticus]|uniref:O-antigen ligase C-terminal domain-containing protein n=1 Tax=Citrobacter amalonaticus TaxID=35703 RepID=A0A9C7QM13_CITAM|nr:O-antigen ligase C-terminal domain-containing protein [Citrobacter amalonaticus]